MRKHTPNIDLKLAGKMNTQDAGRVGKLLAVAGVIAAIGYLAGNLEWIRWW